jgi:hypothetical protein
MAPSALHLDPAAVQGEERQQLSPRPPHVPHEPAEHLVAKGVQVAPSATQPPAMQQPPAPQVFPAQQACPGVPQVAERPAPLSVARASGPASAPSTGRVRSPAQAATTTGRTAASHALVLLMNPEYTPLTRDASGARSSAKIKHRDPMR